MEPLFLAILIIIICNIFTVFLFAVVCKSLSTHKKSIEEISMYIHIVYNYVIQHE